MKGTLLKSKALTDEWMVRYTTYKTIPGIKGVIGSHSRMPESNYIPMHPDDILYLCPGDNGTVINFKIIEVLNEYTDGASMVKYAKLINEEKSTKRSKQKKFTNIMEHNHIKRMYTEDDLLDAMSFAECYIMEHDKPLFLKSNGKPTPDCLNFINSLNK
jgi:hypothetical protein